MSNKKPTVAVYKFSSCDGCQLSLLNMEDELLNLADAIDIAFFLEATRAQRPGPYDIALVEGSITTPYEIERIKEVRAQAKTVIALGTCATAGGIQALRNFADVEAYADIVYGHPEYLHYLKTATPIAEHIMVDMELWGCPVNKAQVIEVIVSLLNNRRPNLPPHSVCLECKCHGTPCVLVDKGIPCIGPATQAGCGAICPSMGRGCYGCFGPAREVNTDAMVNMLHKIERYPGEITRLFRGISGYATTFRAIADEILSTDKEAR